MTMFWDLIVGLCLLGLCLATYTLAKRLETAQSEIKDLSSMVRVLRYNAMESLKNDEKN